MCFCHTKETKTNEIFLSLNSLVLLKMEIIIFLTFFDQFCVIFFWAIDHAESEKIVYFNSRPHILKNFDFFQKFQNFFFQILKIEG
jgi:hypothetical protein